MCHEWSLHYKPYNASLFSFKIINSLKKHFNLNRDKLTISHIIFWQYTWNWNELIGDGMKINKYISVFAY